MAMHLGCSVSMGEDMLVQVYDLFVAGLQVHMSSHDFIDLQR